MQISKIEWGAIASIIAGAIWIGGLQNNLSILNQEKEKRTSQFQELKRSLELENEKNIAKIRKDIENNKNLISNINSNHYKKAGTIVDRSIAKLLESGLNDYKNREYRLALANFNSVLDSYPMNETALLYAARTYRSIGQNYLALPAINKAIDNNNKNPDLFFEKGLILGNTNRHKESIEAYKESINLGKNNASPMNYIASAFINMKEYDSAINSINEALKTDSEIPWHWHTRGRAFLERGDLRKAKLDFEKVIEIEIEKGWSKTGYTPSSKRYLKKIKAKGS